MKDLLSSLHSKIKTFIYNKCKCEKLVLVYHLPSITKICLGSFKNAIVTSLPVIEGTQFLSICA